VCGPDRSAVGEMDRDGVWVAVDVGGMGTVDKEMTCGAIVALCTVGQ